MPPPRGMRLRSTDGAGLASALALHALAGAALLAYEPTRTTLMAAAPLMVELISAPRLEAKPAAALPAPVPPEPRPRPVVRTAPPVVAPPVLAAPPSAPAQMEVVAAPPPPPAPAPAAVAAVKPAELPFTPPSASAANLGNPEPEYPALSRRLGEQGSVLLRVHVSAAGSAQEVLVQASSGFARLDEAARTSVLRWRFAPARRGGEPVPAWGSVTINYRLDDAR